MIVQDKKNCTGCAVCMYSCRFNAINMEKDEKGFCYPKTDTQKCTKCNLCYKKCPVNNLSNKNKYQHKVFAAWSKNKKIRTGSSSGGAFTTFAESFLNDNGIVIGVKWSDEFHAQYYIVSDKKDVTLLNGSKYMQAELGDNKFYQSVKELLLTGKRVLFSGTPCYIHALKLYLDKDYDNLYTIDLICHGVPSSKMFDKYLDELTNNNKSKIKNINLRYKKPTWSFGSVKIEFNDGSTYLKPTVEDAYFNLFNFNYSLRSSCHSCAYADTNRQGDITLADFHGYQPTQWTMRDFEKGVSLIFINSNRGQIMWDNINSGLIFSQSSVEAAKRGNQCLSRPFSAPENIAEFWKDYVGGLSIHELEKKYVTNPYKIPKVLFFRLVVKRYLWIVKNVMLFLHQKFSI